MYRLEEGDIVLVTIESRMSNQQVMTLLAYRVKIGSPPSIDGRAVLTTFNQALNAAGDLVQLYQDCMSNDVKQVRTKVQKIHPLRMSYIERFAVNPDGAVAEDMLSTNLAVVVTRKGEAAGRHSIGNLHLYGCPKSFTTDGEVNGTGVVAYSDLMTKMREEYTVGLASTVLEPIIYNRTTPSASERVQNLQLQLPLRIMRRRTVGLGS